jgi:hypothetical protein
MKSETIDITLTLPASLKSEWLTEQRQREQRHQNLVSFVDWLTMRVLDQSLVVHQQHLTQKG